MLYRIIDWTGISFAALCRKRFRIVRRQKPLEQIGISPGTVVQFPVIFVDFPYCLCSSPSPSECFVAGVRKNSPLRRNATEAACLEAAH